MKLLASFLCFLVVLHCSYAPPVSPEKSKDEDSEIKDNLLDYMEYHRYLKEVVQALESDPEFRERLEKADEEDVRTGLIAEQLDFVNHNVRTKLDEIKRREMERLRHLATKQYELNNNMETDHKPPEKEHLDHQNPNTFEIEDLKKLIKKTTADLEVADKQRRQDFKEYEMQKEFEKHQKLETMDETQKKDYMDKAKAEEDAKKHHQPLHHPGSKQQLEEVWEKQDHMDQQFDPKAFFMMHDVDGNGVWDADEVKALFIKELDKLYGPGGPNKDLHERAEEMERMREHVFKENDHNRDGLIDFNEFMLETQKREFNQDEGWKSIDENQIYTQDEYSEFERRRLEELHFLQSQGLVDAHGRPVPGAEQQIHHYQRQRQALRQQQAYQEQAYHQQQAYHGQQAYQQPQYHAPGQVPVQAYPQGQVPPQGYQQVPQGYPHGQTQYQQIPQGQYQQPQGQFQGQQPQAQPLQGQFQAQPPQVQQPAQLPPQAQHQAQPGSAYLNQGQAPPAPAQPIQGQAPPIQGQAPPIQGQVQPIQGQAQPIQGQAQPIRGQAQPTQGQALLIQGQAQPVQAQGQTIQAQAPPQNFNQDPPAKP